MTTKVAYGNWFSALNIYSTDIFLKLGDVIPSKSKGNV